jgi:hypothetical protein
MGVRGVEFFRRELTPERCARRYADVYDRVLGRTP